MLCRCVKSYQHFICLQFEFMTRIKSCSASQISSYLFQVFDEAVRAVLMPPAMTHRHRKCKVLWPHTTKAKHSVETFPVTRGRELHHVYNHQWEGMLKNHISSLHWEIDNTDYILNKMCKMIKFTFYSITAHTEFLFRQMEEFPI